MKKLYNGKGKRVHPSPPASNPSDHLAVLPTAVLALASALTAEEQEVLAYLLSGGEGGGGGGWERGRGKRKHQQKQQQRQIQHPPELGCGCFGCYKSFWARWDASPNRHLIHRIIDAFEETIESKEKAGSGRSRRRRSGRNKQVEEEDLAASAVAKEEMIMGDGGHVADDDDDEEEDYDDDYEDGDDDGEDGKEVSGEDSGKSSVRRFVSFIGERVWGVWN